MSVFFATEMNFIPDFYFNNKSKFLKNCLNNPYFLCRLFNTGLQIAHTSGLCDDTVFNSNEFSTYNLSFSRNQKILFISLPRPKNSSQISYLSFYCLPYTKTKFSVKPLGLYAIQHFSNLLQENIISFYNASNCEIKYNITPCEVNAFETFCDIIFK